MGQKYLKVAVEKLLVSFLYYAVDDDDPRFGPHLRVLENHASNLMASQRRIRQPLIR
jgi:hypothetical protein